MKKTIRYPWTNKLKLELNKPVDNIIALYDEESAFMMVPETLQGIAVREILAGTRFCVRRRLTIIRTTLSRNFDINDVCLCLLAKATKTCDFGDALDKLQLSVKKSTHFGCADSENWNKTWHQESRDDTIPKWPEVYNVLWRRVGKFFRDHPEYKVK